jgi:hypothetical protein
VSEGGARAEVKSQATDFCGLPAEVDTNFTPERLLPRHGPCRKSLRQNVAHVDHGGSVAKREKTQLSGRWGRGIDRFKEPKYYRTDTPALSRTI